MDARRDAGVDSVPAPARRVVPTSVFRITSKDNRAGSWRERAKRASPAVPAPCSSVCYATLFTWDVAQTFFAMPKPPIHLVHLNSAATCREDNRCWLRATPTVRLDRQNDSDPGGHQYSREDAPVTTVRACVRPDSDGLVSRDKSQERHQCDLARLSSRIQAIPSRRTNRP